MERQHQQQHMVLRWIFALTVARSLVSADILTVQWFVNEESPPGTLIGNLRLALRFKVDAVVLGQSQFSLLPRPNQNLSGFAIDDGNLLTTSSSLDREAVCPLSRNGECLVDLNVGLIRSSQLETLVSVKVVLLDVNDNPPVFSQPQYEVRISELSAPGTTLALPVATDLDSPRFGVQTYRLRSNFQEFQLKLVNASHGSSSSSSSSSPTPHLTLTKTLRLEPEPYSLLLEAFDWGDPSMSGSTTILVSVEDANDHRPTFPDETVQIQVREDHPVDSAVYRASATDDDRGLNSEINYLFVPATSLFHGPKFRLDRTSGEIFLKKSLDFETENSFQLDVMAVDSGVEPLTGHQTIIVQVQDVNDNSPQLTINTLTSHSQSFRDYRGLGAEVSENAPAGSFVAHVSVYDADSGENGQVSCRLVDDDSVHFSLDLMAAGQYKLTTVAEVDYETDRAFIVTVECSDNGQPMMTRRQNVTIGVVDLNDNAPVFSQLFFNVTIPENNVVGAKLLDFKVTDRDSGANAQLVYSIVEPFAAQYVYVDSNISVVRASVALDHEAVQALNFTILAVDSGKPVQSATAQVTVNVEDVNDEEPRFAPNSYEFSLAENSAPGTFVGFVSAVDRDSPPFNQFVFKIVDAFSSGMTELFAIDPRSGKIIAKRSFDREQKDSYHCTVSAIDQDRPSLRSEAFVRIAIDDENDNYPVIRYPPTPRTASSSPSSSPDSFAGLEAAAPSAAASENDSFAVSSAVPLGFAVLTVSAVDLDAGDNARLTYGLANANDVFAIDPDSGVLSTNREFRGVTYEQYRVRVTVRDAGLPPKTSAVDVIVVIDASIFFEDVTTKGDRDDHEFGARVPSSGDDDDDKANGQESNFVFVVIAVSCVVAAVLILVLIVVLAVKVFERRNQPQAVYHCREQERKVLDKIAANSCERRDEEELEKERPLRAANSSLSLDLQRIKRDGNCGDAAAAAAAREETTGGAGGAGAGSGKNGRCVCRSNGYVDALEEQRKLLRDLRDNEPMADIENSSLTDVSGDSGLGTIDESHRIGIGHHLPTMPVASRQNHQLYNYPHPHHLHEDPASVWHEVYSKQSYSLPRNNGLVPQFASTFKGLSQSTTQIVPPVAHCDRYGPQRLPHSSIADVECRSPLIGADHRSRLQQQQQYCAQPQILLCSNLNNNVAKDTKTTTTTKKKPGDSLVDEIRKYKNNRMAKFPAHSSALARDETSMHRGQTRRLFRHADDDYDGQEEEDDDDYDDDDYDDDGLSLRWEGVR